MSRQGRKITLGSLSLFALALLVLAVDSAPIIHTTLGPVSGADTAISHEYVGIPFAVPPLGDLRWRPPVPAPAWGPRVLNATVNPPLCPQPLSFPTIQSEDCLYLNVYVPLGPTPPGGRVVHVFFPGGAFVVNGPPLQTFNGSIWANSSNHIVVVPAYRLGVLGLMGHPAFIEDSETFGNYVLMDHIVALKWVNRNIAAFGGNPNQVTIGGQSAGSISIGIHLTMDHTEGLFQAATMESGAPSVLDPASVYTNISAQVQAFIGCPANQPWRLTLACMRAANVSTLMAAQSANQGYWAKPRPALDGFFIKEQPLALLQRGIFQHNVAIIGGFQTNESTIFDGEQAAFNNLVSTAAAYDSHLTSTYGAQYLPTLSYLYNITPGAEGPLTLPTPFAGMGKADADFGYVCQVRHYIRTIVEAGHQRTWLYRFNRNPPFTVPALGAYHTGELAYTFGHPCFIQKMNAQPPLVAFGPNCAASDPPAWDPVTQPADFALATGMRAVWSAFAETSDANGRGVFAGLADGVAWPQYTAGGNYPNAVWDADDTTGKARVTIEYRNNEERCDFWDSILPPL